MDNKQNISFNTKNKKINSILIILVLIAMLLTFINVERESEYPYKLFIKFDNSFFKDYKALAATILTVISYLLIAYIAINNDKKKLRLLSIPIYITILIEAIFLLSASIDILAKSYEPYGKELINHYLIEIAKLSIFAIITELTTRKKIPIKHPFILTCCILMIFKAIKFIEYRNLIIEVLPYFIPEIIFYLLYLIIGVVYIKDKNIKNKKLGGVMNRNNVSKISWNVWGKIFAFISIIPLFLGFYKMYAYNNGEAILEDPVNAYVGGDAYNYIINANYATGYFVQAGILIMAAIGCGILWYLQEIALNTDKVENIINEEIEIKQETETL